jgi:Domain of unknown function (DUF4411)
VSFSFDTSAILDAWVRHYPPDIFPSVWERMDQAASGGGIYVIDEVVTELKRKDDGIHAWIEDRETMVVAIDESIQAHVALMMKDYPRLVDTKKNRSGCDPWVIALAQSRGHTVVTAERPTGSLNKPKIPDVCAALKIDCIDVVEFFRRQGWKL